MSDLQDIIDLLLTKRECLLDERAKEINSAIEEITRTITEKYAVRADKIETLLKECGYVEEQPVNEPAEPEVTLEELIDNADFVDNTVDSQPEPQHAECELPTEQAGQNETTSTVEQTIPVFPFGLQNNQNFNQEATAQ